MNLHEFEQATEEMEVEIKAALSALHRLRGKLVRLRSVANRTLDAPPDFACPDPEATYVGDAYETRLRAQFIASEDVAEAMLDNLWCPDQAPVHGGDD